MGKKARRRVGPVGPVAIVQAERRQVLGAGNRRFDALDELAGAVELERRATAKKDRAVCAARKAGATWRDLAKILGVSPQAVQQRYGAK